MQINAEVVEEEEEQSLDEDLYLSEAASSPWLATMLNNLAAPPRLSAFRTATVGSMQKSAD